MNRPAGLGGCVVLSILAFLAAGAPWIAPYDPYTPVGESFEPPSSAHWLGTNDVGHDLASEILYGARATLTVGLLTALFSTILGTFVALLAGYSRGRTDAVLMGGVDLALSIPFLPLAIVLSVYLGSSMTTVTIVLSALLWARAAREIRSQVLSVRERDYVQAARTMGASRLHIIRRHILPAVWPLIIPQFLRAASRAVFYETSLSFLGLGDPVHKSWGATLFYAHAHVAFLTDAWTWWILPTGFCIVATNVSLALIGHAIGTRAEIRRLTPSPNSPPLKGERGRPGDDRGELLSVKDLVSTYASNRGDVRAVDGANFELKRGEVLGIVGPSGSGKTTLAMALLRLIRPGQMVHGEIVFDGTSLFLLGEDDMRALRGSRIAFIPQNAMNALNPVFRVRDQISEAIHLHQPVDRNAAVRMAIDLLDQVRVPATHADAYPHELSGGMRQRVVLAMALANRPLLLIADEPTSNLDSINRREILDLLNGLRARHGLSMILISHDTSLVNKMSAHVIVMTAGKIVQGGPVSQLPDSAAPPKRQSADTAGLSTAILKLTRLNHRFSIRGRLGFRLRTEIRALENVDLEVREGEFVGVIGGSGSGKTTLARIVVGLIRPTSGHRTFAGRRIPMIFQDPYESLNPKMCVEDIVAEPLAIRHEGNPEERRRRVLQSLTDVGLIPPEEFVRRYPHELSGGQRQRVALARAMIVRPRLIVADEPTSMLDAAARAGFLDALLDLKCLHRLSGLFMTHDLTVARAVCDRLVVLKDGRIAEEGPIDRLIHSPQHPYTRALLEAASL